MCLFCPLQPCIQAWKCTAEMFGVLEVGETLLPPTRVMVDNTTPEESFGIPRAQLSCQDGVAKC
eukprot:CAMPEP_0179199308 /NCGR_PEP_ID=MMETSP0796-20121207/99156_1 /TAXON_ID=73915 /ORGANISM="Pyrodinium bahamense, Strain pbaha01" /LENGTH=63 /DNA_ID=CAMNT_0020903801 /DNA_START=173 /DNA_END=361 /DNA_ORIENTATION=-